MGIFSKIKSRIKSFYIFREFYKIHDLSHRNIRDTNAIITSQIIASLHTPNATQAILALIKRNRPCKMISDSKNIMRYLELVRPSVSSQLELVRIGGDADGGYCMPPPPSNL